jgi:hypothetical protein
MPAASASTESKRALSIPECKAMKSDQLAGQRPSGPDDYIGRSRARA